VNGGRETGRRNELDLARALRDHLDVDVAFGKGAVKGEKKGAVS
jgi:hypothetical protein